MSKKILIVDDEPHLRLLLERTLEEFEERGVEILTAGNGETALEIIRSKKPDMVFLDVTMPTITGYEVCGRQRELKNFEEPGHNNDSGYEVCRQVKKEWEMKDVYIVMLTARGHEIDKTMGFEAGVDVYLNKPFDPDTVIKLAGDILKI